MRQTSRIESELEVKAYLQNLKYALEHGAQVTFQIDRFVDSQRDFQYTNEYTMDALFKKENPIEAIKRELMTLTVEEYMRTVADKRFPNKSEMREFGKVYNGTEDVYIKIRVDLLGVYGSPKTFVMSFHFAETPFEPEMFPYRKK